MEKEIAEGKFIEHAYVHGNIYGTSFDSVMKVVDKKKICILDIDIQGVQQVMKSGMKADFVFIKPPTYEELERRLRGRGTDSEESIQLRLKNSIKEIETAEEIGFPHVIVNTTVKEAYDQLRSIVLPVLEKMHQWIVCLNKSPDYLLPWLFPLRKDMSSYLPPWFLRYAFPSSPPQLVVLRRFLPLLRFDPGIWIP